MIAEALKDERRRRLPDLRNTRLPRGEPLRPTPLASALIRPTVWGGGITGTYPSSSLYPSENTFPFGG